MMVICFGFGRIRSEQTGFVVFSRSSLAIRSDLCLALSSKTRVKLFSRFSPPSREADEFPRFEGTILEKSPLSLF